jgi:hypothetical protein
VVKNKEKMKMKIKYIVLATLLVASTAFGQVLHPPQGGMHSVWNIEYTTKDGGTFKAHCIKRPITIAACVPDEKGAKFPAAQVPDNNTTGNFAIDGPIKMHCLNPAGQDHMICTLD